MLHRLVTPEFVHELASYLDHDTPVYIQTDVIELFEYMHEIFSNCRYYTGGALDIPINAMGLATDRERLVMSNGGDIHRTQFRVLNPTKVNI